MSSGGMGASGSTDFQPSIEAIEVDKMEIDESSPVHQLSGLVPSIVQNLHKALRNRSVRTRSGAFHILRELCSVLPGCLKNHLGHVLPGLRFTIGDKQSVNNTKIDAIQFLNTLLRTHSPETFYPQLNAILDLVLTCVKDPFYRICSEALLAATNLAAILRPFEPPGISPAPEYQALTAAMYPQVMQVMTAVDKDQEVKDRSITCVAAILYHTADCLQTQLPECLAILCHRLQNEVTRLTAVKAIDKVAKSPLKINLAPILNQSLEIMCSLLRKNQRSLRIQTLLCLQTLFSNYGSHLNEQQVHSIIDELPPLIAAIETDVASSQHSVTLATVLLPRMGHSTTETIKSRLLSVACGLAYSHHLHGSAFDALLEFYGSAVRGGACGTGTELLQMLLHGERGQAFFAAPLAGAMRNEVYFNLARCAAQITVHCDEATRQGLVRDWIGLVTGKGATEQTVADSRRFFALLTLGEIGKHIDLSPHTDLSNVLSAAFQSPQEEWQTGAAIALGKISLGNLSAFVPYILNRIGPAGGSEAKNHYFMLHALKEIISHVAGQAVSAAAYQTLKPHVPQIWSLLERSALSNEEGARNLVSECLGKLALMDSAELLQRLSELLTSSSDSPLVLSTALTAVKFCFIPHAHPADRQLRAMVPRIVNCLEHTDLAVRRASLVAINTGVHNKTALIREHLDALLPQIYKGTAVDESLIRVINMGPFSHKEDAGLDLRKVTFECLYTLAEHCVDRVDLFTFIQHIEVGLKDVPDIRILCFLILERLCARAPSTVFAATDSLVPAIRATFAEKAKEKSVRAELDKQAELKHAAMRVFHCLARLGESKAVTECTQMIMADRGNSGAQLHLQPQSQAQQQQQQPGSPVSAISLYQLYLTVEKELANQN